MQIKAINTIIIIHASFVNRSFKHLRIAAISFLEQFNDTYIYIYIYIFTLYNIIIHLEIEIQNQLCFGRRQEM